MARTAYSPVGLSSRHFRVAERLAPYHTGYVVDTSVAIKWYGSQEKDQDLALRLRAKFVDGLHTLHAPEFMLLEFGNALRFSKASTSTLVASHLEHLKNFGVVFHSLSHAQLLKANTLAWEFGLTLYDAYFVALAEDLGLPLITADEQLLRRLDGSPLALPLQALR